MLAESISKIKNQIMGFFEGVNKLGKKSNFTKREGGKVTAKAFVKCLVMGCLSNERISLQEMCQFFKEDDIEISKQGLHQRFNSEATELMAECFKKTLTEFKTSQKNMIDLLKPFKEVTLLDSSTVKLPNEMEDVYPGCGGTRPKSSLKIQTLYNYVDGQIQDIIFTPGRKNDQGFQGHHEQIVPRVLYLQDLGYFKIKSFIEMQNKEAYFISRYLNKTALYEKNGEKIDLFSLFDGKQDFFSKEILLGEKQKVPVRLIAKKLEPDQAARAEKHLLKAAKKEQRTPKPETLKLAAWSICITNVPKEMVKDENVYLIYSLRWQIELFFKLCKQEAGIDKIRAKKTDRVLCEIYAKLICIVMLLYLCFPLRWQNKTELSFSKAYKCLRQRALDFFRAIASKYRLEKFLTILMEKIQKFTMKDIKKKKPATHQKMMAATGQVVFA